MCVLIIYECMHVHNVVWAIYILYYMYNNCIIAYNCFYLMQLLLSVQSLHACSLQCVVSKPKSNTAVLNGSVEKFIKSFELQANVGHPRYARLHVTILGYAFRIKFYVASFFIYYPSKTTIVYILSIFVRLTRPCVALEIHI